MHTENTFQSVSHVRIVINNTDCLPLIGHSLSPKHQAQPLRQLGRKNTSSMTAI